MQQKSNKSVNEEDSGRVSPSFTDEQLKILDSLKGEMGSNRSDVLKSIFIAWLSEKNIAPALIRKRMKLH